MPRASIQFLQPGGGGSGVVGQALIGSLALPVTVAAAVDPSIVNWTYAVVSSPPGSAVPIGLAQDGTVPTWIFTPDSRGGYELHLVTRNAAGDMAEDYRVFQVAEASGRIIPPFGADDGSFNFAGQLLGWAPYLRAYLLAVDAVTPGVPRVVTGATATATSADAAIALNRVGGVNLTLELAPANGQHHDISALIANAADSTITAGGGSTVNGNATYTLPAGSSISLIYFSTLTDWRPF